MHDFVFSFFSHTSTFQLLDKPWSQVSSFLPPRLLPSIFIAHRIQQSHCSSIFHRVLLTRALALSESQLVHMKMSPQKIIRVYYKYALGGFELTKLTYTMLEDNLIRHRGDRHLYAHLTVHKKKTLVERAEIENFEYFTRNSSSRTYTVQDSIPKSGARRRTCCAKVAEYHLLIPAGFETAVKYVTQFLNSKSNG